MRVRESAAKRPFETAHGSAKREEQSMAKEQASREVHASGATPVDAATTQVTTQVTAAATTQATAAATTQATAAATTQATATTSPQKEPQRWTVRALLAWIVPYLRERAVESPRTIAEILLADVLSVERLRLYMEPDRELAPDELATLRGLVARAGRHEPVQFLVGTWPFLGRDFEVAPCTLIPRPCTETLVEYALAWYRARGAGSVRALDLCTGSGCIAVSLALGMRAILRPDGSGCRPVAVGAGSIAVGAGSIAVGARSIAVGAGTIASHAHDPLPEINLARAEPAPVDPPQTLDPTTAPIAIVATDVVHDAVVLARRNATRLGADIEFRIGDLWEPIASDERFDLIVSNPPYVTDAEYDALDRNVREYEPATALRGGADGLDFVRRVVVGAQRQLRPGGLLLIEIGWKHRADALALVSGADWSGTDVLKDGEGIDRVLVAVWRGAASAG
jgi:release factor glutamine methyltransferase